MPSMACVWLHGREATGGVKGTVGVFYFAYFLVPHHATLAAAHLREPAARDALCWLVPGLERGRQHQRGVRPCLA